MIKTKLFKKLRVFPLLSLFSLISLNYVQANDYEYKSLDITANILIEGTMEINENFTANFSTYKHGIIRSIPLNYSVQGSDFHINISNINVRGKKFTTNLSNGTRNIKIGDPDKTIIGEQYYPISYKVYGLIRNFSGMGYAELYWNLVGYDFDTNINKVKAEIYLPKIYTGFTSDDFLITTDGSTKTVKEFGGKISRNQGNKITITYDKPLPAYQGITLAIKFPNDYFEFDHDKQAALLGKAKDSLGGAILNFLYRVGGIFCLVGLIVASTIVKKKNTGLIETKSGTLKGDFAKEFPVIVQYDPPQGVNSAEAGLLLHREAKAKDILSLIYKRAAEGLISISLEESEGSIFKKSNSIVILSKNKDIPVEYPDYEKDFFKSLIRSEKNKIEPSTNLYNKLGLSTLEKYGETKGWFKNNKTKGGTLFFGYLIAYILLKIIEESYPGLAVILILILIFLGIYLGAGSKLKETEEGAKLISHTLGYREFLKACDENKLRLFLQQDPLYFDKILPYAVAFGLDTELLKKVEPIMKEMNIKSSRYDGDVHSVYIINNTISSSANHSLPPSSSYSSSGGFSGGSSFGGGFSIGGGGGGGGGRSW